MNSACEDLHHLMKIEMFHRIIAQFAGKQKWCSILPCFSCEPDCWFVGSQLMWTFTFPETSTWKQAKTPPKKEARSFFHSHHFSSCYPRPMDLVHVTLIIIYPFNLPKQWKKMAPGCLGYMFRGWNPAHLEGILINQRNKENPFLNKQ